ncbi:hypothetical protein BsWGS_23059 [Bradybaena similaris]
MDVRLNVVLIGRTGCGISATGNTLLGRRVFESKVSCLSLTEQVDFDFGHPGRYRCMVVDTPPIISTNATIEEGIEAAIKNMKMVMSVCHGGVDAFILVVHAGYRLNSEDRSMLEYYKRILGDSLYNDTVVVATRGDYWLEDAGIEDTDTNFDTWCKQQTALLGELYKDCEGRLVLFNNNERNDEKNKVQREQLMDLVWDLHTRKGPYSSECFQKINHEQFLSDVIAPRLSDEIQMDISTCTEAIKDLNKIPTDSKVEKIRAQIRGIKEKLERLDKEYASHGLLSKHVTKVEKQFNMVVQLVSLQKSLKRL